MGELCCQNPGTGSIWLEDCKVRDCLVVAGNIEGIRGMAEGTSNTRRGIRKKNH